MFVASIFGSGEARRGSIPLSGAVTDLPAGRQGSNEARTEKRRNPSGGSSIWPNRRCSLLTDPEGYARVPVRKHLAPRPGQKSLAANGVVFMKWGTKSAR